MKHLTKLVIAGVAMSLCMGVANARSSHISQGDNPDVKPVVAVAKKAAVICNLATDIMTDWYAGIGDTVANFNNRAGYVADTRTIQKLEAQLKGAVISETAYGTCQSAATATAGVNTISATEGTRFGPANNTIFLEFKLGTGCSVAGLDEFTLLFTLLDNASDGKQKGTSVGVHTAFPGLSAKEAQVVAKRLKKAGCLSTPLRGITYAAPQ
jgi:hypothetical protein